MAVVKTLATWTLMITALLLVGCSRNGPAPDAQPPHEPAEDSTNASLATPPSTPPTPLPDDARFDGYHDPIPGNRLVTSRADLLYVVWSIPKSLEPFSDLLERSHWEPFILNTALHMCTQELVRKTGDETICLVHVLQLASNDEYSTAASAGWHTVGKVRVPISQLEGTSSQALRSGTVGELRARFSEIGLDLSQLGTPDAG